LNLNFIIVTASAQASDPLSPDPPSTVTGTRTARGGGRERGHHRRLSRQLGLERRRLQG
jgi:hypothetical protein